jgi:hypothetical protein
MSGVVQASEVADGRAAAIGLGRSFVVWRGWPLREEISRAVTDDHQGFMARLLKRLIYRFYRPMRVSVAKLSRVNNLL